MLSTSRAIACSFSGSNHNLDHSSQALQLAKLDARVNSVEVMQERPDLSESNGIRTQTLTRSRYHYRPISSAEFIFTLVLSIFIGVGIFVASTINGEQNGTNSQIQPTIEPADR